MFKLLVLTAALHLACGAEAQSTLSVSKDVSPILESTSTLVTVPILVRDGSGEFFRDMTADQLVLLDNGIGQKISLDKTNNDPISLVILMQTGGMSDRQFKNYLSLPTLLTRITGNSIHEITLVTFDSRIEEVWHFPIRSEGVNHALTHPLAGDQGAAILDAISFGVGQLQHESGRYRRIVLLFSQSADSGSKISPQEAIKQLGEGSTTVYSLTFPLPGPKRKVKPTKPYEPNMSQPMTPLDVALLAMIDHTAEELSFLSGGEHLDFSSKRDLDTKLLNLADDIHNSYTVAFQPNRREPGFHKLNIRCSKEHSRLEVTGRSSYWFDATKEMQ